MTELDSPTSSLSFLMAIQRLDALRKARLVVRLQALILLRVI